MRSPPKSCPSTAVPDLAAAKLRAAVAFTPRLCSPPYLTHFFATIVLAGVLWLVAHEYFRRWMGMVCLLAVMGFVTYPIAMAFALVYMAEHYAADVIIGWGYAGLAYFAVGRLVERRAAAPTEAALAPATG